MGRTAVRLQNGHGATRMLLGKPRMDLYPALALTLIILPDYVLFVCQVSATGLTNLDPW